MWPQCGELPLCGGQGWRLHSGDLSSAFPQASFSDLGKICYFSGAFSKSFSRELINSRYGWITADMH